ncbi:MAG: hypothetical protein ACE5ES_05975 [Candidatus Nanoarchaeia archaeon]
MDKDKLLISGLLVLGIVLIVSILGSNMTGHATDNPVSKSFSVIEGRTRAFTLEGDIYKLTANSFNANSAHVTLRKVETHEENEANILIGQSEEMIDVSVTYRKMYNVFLGGILGQRARFKVQKIAEPEEPPAEEGVSLEDVLDMLNGCLIYSVSSPDPDRDVNGNDICEERDAGTCIFTVNYNELNEAVNDVDKLLSGSNAGIIESCSLGPYASDEVVAYCCSA